jgi:hypothetical protein
VSDIGEAKARLLEAYGECQNGQCSCPTNEYYKLESVKVEPGEDVIRMRLEPKPGEKFDAFQIAACLDYKTATIAQTNNDPEQRGRPLA